jgi:hypothetical protein
MGVRRRFVGVALAGVAAFAFSGVEATPAAAVTHGLSLVHSNVTTVAPISTKPLPPPGECFSAPHPPFGPCGEVFVDVTIAGFAGYGGLPECPATNPYCSYDGALRGGTVQAKWTIRCVANGVKLSGKETLGLNIIWPGVPSDLNYYTRIDNDSATLRAGASFRFLDQAASSCPGSSYSESSANLVSLSLELVVAHFQSTTYPSMDFKIAGMYDVL